MNKKELTLGSLFDGSGGFPLGGILAGIKPVFASEIEPFPILVTHKRLPQMKHYGDVSTLKGSEIEPVDIITFGSPCQDMSIAGRRSGLKGERSVLFFQAIRIIKEMREATNGKYPRYCVWENVTGACSSNGGNDFKAVLEAVIGVKEEGVQVPAPENHRWPKADVYLGDGWSVAYRVFDSQYWSIPQRRARIYLVADFDGESAGEVLFKSEGLSGYTPEGCRPWERTAGGTEEGIGETGRYCLNPQGQSGITITEDQTGTLIAQDHGNHPSVLYAAGFSTEHSSKSRSIGYEAEKSPCLRSGVVPAAMLFDNHHQDSRYDGPLEECPTVTARYGTGGNNTPLIAEPQEKPDDASHTEIKAFGICSKESFAMKSSNPHAGFYEAETSRTLDQGSGNPGRNQGGICVVAPAPNEEAVAFEPGAASRIGGHIYDDGKCGTLRANAGDNKQAVAVPTAYSLQGSMIGRAEKNGPQGSGINEEVSFSLTTVDHHAVAVPSGEHYSTSKNSYHTSAILEQANTLVASDYKDPPCVNDRPADEPMYIVRRLTPVECCRLQGFPDFWCSDLAITDPTEEDLTFWTDVWETWRKVTNPAGKPKTEKQIRKWLASPYTDSAEYRLWGNGVSLPIPFFVISGIKWAAEKE